MSFCELGRKLQGQYLCVSYLWREILFMTLVLKAQWGKVLVIRTGDRKCAGEEVGGQSWNLLTWGRTCSTHVPLILVLSTMPVWGQTVRSLTGGDPHSSDTPAAEKLQRTEHRSRDMLFSILFKNFIATRDAALKWVGWTAKIINEWVTSVVQF